MPCHWFACQWISIVSISFGLVLKRTPLNSNNSGRVSGMQLLQIELIFIVLALYKCTFIVYIFISVTAENDTRSKLNSYRDSPKKMVTRSQLTIKEYIFAAEKVHVVSERVQYNAKCLNYPMSESTWEADKNIFDWKLWANRGCMTNSLLCLSLFSTD